MISQELAPAQRRRLHPDYLENERTYMTIRDDLLKTNHGRWVAVRLGQVIASGADLLAVMEAAGKVGGHPYVARVGGEEETVFSVRREAFRYDTSYRPFPACRGAWSAEGPPQSSIRVGPIWQESGWRHSSRRWTES